MEPQLESPAAMWKWGEMVCVCNPSTGCGSEIGSYLHGAYCLASLDEMMRTRCSEGTHLKNQVENEWGRPDLHTYTYMYIHLHTHVCTSTHPHTDLKKSLVQFSPSRLTNVPQWLIGGICPSDFPMVESMWPLAWIWGLWFLAEGICFIWDRGLIVFHKLPTMWEVLDTECPAIQGAETAGKGRDQKRTWKWTPSCDQKHLVLWL